MTRTHPFITYLEGLREDRAALAALRRVLGQPIGTVREMFPYVVRWVGDSASRREESTYYLTASHFAYHPDPGGSGNLGDAFARARKSREEDTAIERRFTTLLAAHPDDLPDYLRQAIGFLKSKEVPVNWHQLFYDLRGWSHPDAYIQKRWARAFWGRPTKENEPSAQEV